MQPRLDANKIAPDAFKAISGLQAYVDACGLEKRLLELVKVRASQINGCAFCIAMHSRDARKLGETDERLLLLSAWQETPGYSERERAALAWTEAVTLVTNGNVRDEVFEIASKQFSQKELVDLTYAIMAINAWNRLAISFRKRPAIAVPSS